MNTSKCVHDHEDLCRSILLFNLPWARPLAGGHEGSQPLGKRRLMQQMPRRAERSDFSRSCGPLLPEEVTQKLGKLCEVLKHNQHIPDTPWDCHICRHIDPPNHHPWPDRQSYSSPISRVWV